MIETLNDTRVGRAASRPGPLRRFAAMAKEAVDGLSESDAASITGRSVRLPQWLAMALIGWLFGSAYWAGRISTTVETQAAGILESRQQTETNRLEVMALRKEVAYLTGVVAGRAQKGD